MKIASEKKAENEEDKSKLRLERLKPTPSERR